MKIGSLFSGIGGIELAFHNLGIGKTVWHCETNPYCSELLKERFPNTPNLGDINKINWMEVEKVDILCGGFPCQDVSVAGRQEGLKEGNRTGLWYEYAKAIRTLRPRWVFAENVTGLIATGGLGIVLGCLAELGYDAEWQVISAAEVGAPHKRERVFIVAYPTSQRRRTGSCDEREYETHSERKPSAQNIEQWRGMECGVVMFDADTGLCEQSPDPLRSGGNTIDYAGW